MVEAVFLKTGWSDKAIGFPAFKLSIALWANEVKGSNSSDQNPFDESYL